MQKSLSIILLVLAAMTAAVAQTTTGRLSGTVSGPDGLLPNATVVARDNKTGKELTVTTTENGAFLFSQLEFGTYTVTITSAGFKTFIANDVKIDVGREHTLGPTMELGSLEENVTVTAGADVVTATSAQVSNTVSPQQILSLPLITRNPLGLTVLQAGVQSNAFQETAINGMRTSFTNITRDGINIQDNFIRQNATDFAPGRPSVDDTAEFTITTSNQEADQGYGGAQIRLVTPRGTSDFHGALFAYNRNSDFAANSFFNNRAGHFVATDALVLNGVANVGDPRNPRPFRNRNQFGGKVSGPLPLPGFGDSGGPPVVMDKGFFFFAYEKIIDPQSGAQQRTVLTDTARTGIFTYNRTAAGAPISTPFVNCPSGAAQSLCTANILGLANSLGFANTPTTINPVIQTRILSQMPQRNFSGGDAINTSVYRFLRRANVERTTYTGRLDVDFDEKNTINGVYSWVLDQSDSNAQDPTGFTQAPRGNLASKNKTLALAYRRNVTSTLINDVRGGIFFSDVQFGSFENPSLLLGLPLALSNPENNTLSQGRVVKTYNLQDNVDWVLGDHSLRFGGQMQIFRPTSTDNFGVVPTLTIATSSATPFFTCANAATCQLPGQISAAQLGTANGLLALLAGYVSQEAQTFNLISPTEGFGQKANVAPYRYANHSLYIADRWSAMKNLTITGGLRYELFPAMKQTDGIALEPVIADGEDPRAALLNRNGISDVIGGNSGTEFAFYKTDYNNFAPQIGFAWSPQWSSGIGRILLGETFVVRGGYGHVYGNDQLVTSVLQAPGNIVGLASRNGFGLTPSGSALLNLRLGDPLPAIVTPTLNPPPPFSFIRNNTPGIGGANVNGTIFGIDPNLQTPMYQQYSFGIQREFMGNTALEIRYVGTRSDNLPRASNLNQLDIINNGFLADFNRALSNLRLPGATTAFCNPTTVAGCQPLSIFRSSAPPTATTVGGATAGPGGILIGTGGLAAATFNQLVRAGTPGDLVNNIFQLGFNNHPTLNNPTAVPFVNLLPNPAGGTIALLENDAYSRYNALQVEVRRRFSQGLYFQANYTFSKTTTNAIGGDQFYFEPYLDNGRPELDEQRADFDQTHVFNFNGVYQLPFGKGKPFLNSGGIVNAIFGGWELSGIMQWTTGAPVTIVDPRGTFNTGGRSARQTANSSLSIEEIRALTGVFEANGNIYWINPSILGPTGAPSAGFGQTPFAGQVFFNNEPGATGTLPRTLINGPRVFNIDAALLKNFAISEQMRLQLRMEAFNILNNVNFNNITQNTSINATNFGQITTSTAARTLQFAARFEF